MNKNWHELVSQTKYEMVLEEDMWVTMRDGIRLSVDVYRPRAEGKFPALVSFSGFGKDQQKLPSSAIWQPMDTVRGNGGHECGEQWYFVPRGYVQVIPDPRGVGKSEGNESEFYGQDGYDLIEWIAEQPWCNGNVGMLGMSAFAWAQYQIADQQPPHLKAIFPFESATDSYRHSGYHGGIPNYLGQVRGFRCPSRVVGGVVGGVPRQSSFEEFSEEELQEKIRQLQNNPDIRCTPSLYVITLRPELNLRIFGMMLYPYDGPYHQRASGHSKLKDIKIPSYLGSRWDGWTMHLPGAFDSYENIATPREHKKLLLVPCGMDRPFHEIQDVCLRWYDHWLKGIDTGILDEPPILLFIQGINEWRYENEWPLAATEWAKFYLREGGGLSTNLPGGDEEPQVFTNNPWAREADPVPKVIYETEPLSENMEVTGPIALYWHASIESKAIQARSWKGSAIDGLEALEPLTNDTDWYLKVKDIDVDGSERPVTGGWLKASHYELNESKSKPYAPYHPHTRSLPIKPGEVVLYASDIRMTSNVFLAGHKIRLEITGQDPGYLRHMAEVKHTVYTTRDRPSYLLLPVIPKGYGGAGEPSCPPAGPFRMPKYQRKF